MERGELQNSEAQGDLCSEPKWGVGKSSTVYNLGAGLAVDSKKVLQLDPRTTSPRCWGQRKLHDLPLTLANAMYDVVSGM